MIKKLIKIQKELKAPKNLRNNFGNYNYRNCEAILEAVKPLLAKEGLLLTITDRVELIGDRYYVVATVIITDGEKEVKVEARAREEETKRGMDGSQITGAASSYARKYALNGLFAIDDTKDADDQDNSKHVTLTFGADNNLPLINANQIDAMIKYVKEGKKQEVINSLKKYRWTNEGKERIKKCLLK